MLDMQARAGSMAPTPSFERAMCFVTFSKSIDEQEILRPLLDGRLADYLTGEIPDATKGSLLLPMRAGMVVVMLIDAPMPLFGPADDLAQRTAWGGWRMDAKHWRSHAIVSAFGTPTSLDQARIWAKDILQVSAILAAHTGASGVQWSGSQLFFPANEFTRRCSKDTLPADILFRTCWYRPEGNSMGAITKGLALFALPEIDLSPSSLDAVTVYQRLLNLAAYLLASGLILKEGDSVGADAIAESRIQHVYGLEGRLTLKVVAA